MLLDFIKLSLTQGKEFFFLLKTACQWGKHGHMSFPESALSKRVNGKIPYTVSCL